MQSALLLLSSLCLMFFTPCKSFNPRLETPSRTLDILTNPYTRIFSNFKSASDFGFNSLHNYLEKCINPQNPPQEVPSYIYTEPTPLIKEENTESILDDEFPEEFTDDTTPGRVLQANPCQNQGKYRLLLVKVYTCNKREVPKQTYINLNGKGCTVANKNKYVCYCSYNTYGDTCAQMITHSCTMERISPIHQCQGKDSYDYVYSYSGVPPCFEVGTGDTATIVTKVNCSVDNTTYFYEGVKTTRYDLITQPNLGNVFTYVVNTDYIKLLAMPEGMAIRTTFINWNDQSLPYNFDTLLTPPNLIGTPIETKITFDEKLKNYAQYGRYYYELSFVVNASIMTPVGPMYLAGNFEQKGYKEPPYAEEKSKKTFIFIIIALVVAMAILGTRLYRKWKSKNELIKIATIYEEEPLIQGGERSPMTPDSAF